MPTKLPTVSVLVPCYNAIATIDETIQSILKQEEVDVQIVVADDHSDDGTFEHLGEVSNRCPELSVHRTPRRRGPAAARNFALSLSSGPFVSTLDSDDVLLDPRKLSLEAAVVQRAGGNAVAYSNIRLIDLSGRTIRDVTPDSVPITLRNLLARRCFVPRDMTTTKDLLEEVGGWNDAIKMYEDWDLKIRLAERASYIGTGVDGVGYRRHSQGLSNSSDAEYWRKYVFLSNIDRLENPDERVRAATDYSIFASAARVEPILHEDGLRSSRGGRKPESDDSVGKALADAESVGAASKAGDLDQQTCISKPFKRLELERVFVKSIGAMYDHFQDVNFFDRDYMRSKYGVDVGTGNRAYRRLEKKHFARGVRPNPFFDPEWYSNQYGVSIADSARDFCDYGWRVGRLPSAGFDQFGVYARYPEILGLGIDYVSYVTKTARAMEPHRRLSYYDSLLPEAVQPRTREETVSVVTINLDNRIGLERTLESVAGQDYKSIQLVVVDGGSTDGSLAAVDEFRQRNPDLAIEMIVGQDESIWHAQSIGAEAAAGDWVIFMNSGDRFFAGNTVSTVMGLPFAHVIFGGAVCDGESTFKTFQKRLDQGMAFSHQSMYARKELFDVVRYDITSPVADYKFIVESLRSGAIFVGIDEPLAMLESIGVSWTAFTRRALARWHISRNVFGRGVDEYFVNLISKRSEFL